LIAGKVFSDEYSSQLVGLTKSPNISLKFEILSAQDLVNQIGMTDLICLPFTDSLTSGSAILAMSCNKALLLPEKARVFGCVPEKGVRYFQSTKQLK